MSTPELDALLQKSGNRPVTLRGLHAVLKPLLDDLSRVVIEQRARIEKLEARPSVKFAGVFEGGKSYEPGDMVQHASSLWICMAPTAGTPSKDFVGWRLVLKKGDAR